MNRVWTGVALFAVLVGQPRPALAQFKVTEVSRVEIKGESGFGSRFSPDGKVLVHPRTSDGKLRVYDAATGKEIASRLAPALEFGTVGSSVFTAFSPDGTLFAFNKVRGGGVSLWDTKTWKQAAVLRLPDPQALAFSPDSRALAVQYSLPTNNNYSAAVSIWDVKGDKGVRERAALLGGQSAPVYSPDGKLLFTGGCFWNTETEDEWKFPNEKAMQDGVSRLQNLAFSPDSKLFFARGRFWDVKTGKEVLTAESVAGGRWAPIFSPDGKLLAVQPQLYVAGIDLISVETGKKLGALKDASFPVVFGKDSKTLTGAVGGAIVTWELAWEEAPAK